MGPKKAKSKMPVDGVDTTSMSREQLEAFCIRLREELDREREERNFFQLERDKLRTFWEITRQQLEESRAQQRNQDRAIDELEEKHQAEIKVYKQKVKHLLYEHQCNLSELQVESMVSLKQAQDDYSAMEQQLLKDKKELKEQLYDMELKHLEEMKQLKIDHSAEVSRVREQLESDSAELEKKYETRLMNQAEEQAMREKMEQAELETRKNQHIVDLTKQHETAFQEMKNYYNDITLNNLALISTLKEQIEELKANHDRMEKQLTACQAENKKLTEPLKQAQSELGLLRRQLTTYEQDKVTLANTKQRLALVTKELEDLRWENDVLELRFEKVEKERDRLHAEFVGAVLDVQQKTGLKGALLEKRMTSMRSGVSQRTSVSVTGCNTNIEQQSASGRKSRPSSAPLQTEGACETRPRWDRLFVSRRSQAKAPNDDDVPKRPEPCVVKVKGRVRRSHLSENSKTSWIKAITHRTALATNPSEKDDGWSTVFSEASPPRTGSRIAELIPQSNDSCWATLDFSTRDKNTELFPPTCICGQHANGCRVTTVDTAMPSAESINLTFDYLAKNYMKHRYYPQILDCVRHSLSPIHSQEHASEASIHDSMDKPAKPVPHQVFSEEDRRPDTAPKDPLPTQNVPVRPLSASRSDGRDIAFTKENTVFCSNTTTSLVFSKFIPLPPRPNLPWLHGVKSRYFSAYSSHKKKECTHCHKRPAVRDIGIQTSEHALSRFSPAERRRLPPGNAPIPTSKPSDSDDLTHDYVSQILKNPFQLSYTVGHMDRNYAAIITSPKNENHDLTDAIPKNFVKTWAEECASFGTVSRSKVVNDDSLSKRRTSRTNLSLSVSPLRLIDIESEGSDTNSQAMNTPIHASYEDTGTGISSLSNPSQVDLKISSDFTKSIDVVNSVTSVKHYRSSKENSVERKHERTPLKRKFKATVLRRLKLKLMICSYMHRHDEEGDVNFVHPSARKRLVEPISLHRLEDTSYEVAESSLESVDTRYPLGEDSVTAAISAAKSFKVPSCSRFIDEKPHWQYFCCVCENEITLRDLAEGGQVCCDECQRKADALLGEYECSHRGQEIFDKQYDGSQMSDVFSMEKITGESLRKELSDQPTNAQVEHAFSGNACSTSKQCLAECDELSSDLGANFWTGSCYGGDSFDTDRSSNAEAEMFASGGRLVGDKFTEKCEKDVASHAKQLDDSCKTVFKNLAHAVQSEAGLVNDSFTTEFDSVSNAAEVSKRKFVGDKEERLFRESCKGKEGNDHRDVLFTLSAVQTAIRSAMRMINPIKSPVRSSPVESSSRRSVIRPQTPDNFSRPLTPTITSPGRLSPTLPFSVRLSRSSSCPSPPSEQHLETLATPDLCSRQLKLDDPSLCVCTSDPQQLPHISTPIRGVYPPQQKYEGPSPFLSIRDNQRHPFTAQATSDLYPTQCELEDPSLSLRISDPQQLSHISTTMCSPYPPQQKFEDPSLSLTRDNQQHPFTTQATSDFYPTQCDLEDPSLSLCISDPVQLPYISTATFRHYPPQREFEVSSPCQITSNSQQHLNIPPATSSIYPSHPKFDDPTPCQSRSDPQQHINSTHTTSDFYQPEENFEDSSPSQSTSVPQQNPSITAAISDIGQPQHKLEGPYLPMSTTAGAESRASTKPFYVCPLAVPRGILKGNPRKMVYTEYPVRTYDFPTNKLACVSKQRNMLVFYEVSNLRKKSERVRTNIPSSENETLVKDPFSLPRVSRIDTRPIVSSQFMLRPSRSSLSEPKAPSIVDIRQEGNLITQNERLKSVGATANFSESYSVVDQMRGPPKFSDSRFDLLERRRRESWILSDKSSPSKEVIESAKAHHRSEKLAKEDDVRLSSDKDSLVASNRDKRCQCLKRGRKCHCSLTNHLHIRPLNLTRQLNIAPVCPKISKQLQSPHFAWEENPVKKYRESALCKSKKAWPSGEEFWDSPVRKAGTLRRSGQPGNVVVQRRPMSTLVEDSCEALLCQEDGSAPTGPSEVKAPAIPTPPPPSPNTAQCSPLSTGRRDSLSRRQADNVSLREDQSNCTRYLPPLPLRRQPNS